MACYLQPDDTLQAETQMKPEPVEYAKADEVDDDSDNPMGREPTAFEEDRPLGMKFKGAPPGCLEVYAVAPGTWAERVGMVDGT